MVVYRAKNVRIVSMSQYLWTWLYMTVISFCSENYSHYITGSHHTGTWLLLSLLRRWHTPLSLFSTKWSNGSCRISGCLADISAWMKEHHLQLNLAKTELLVFPATPTLQHDFSIQLGTSIITPSTSVRNLGVIFDDQLTFKEHIAKTARSCRFALHN